MGVSRAAQGLNQAIFIKERRMRLFIVISLTS
jgi:hypothetical protein